jgi:hypothetical protein
VLAIGADAAYRAAHSMTSNLVGLRLVVVLLVRSALG